MHQIVKTGTAILMLTCMAGNAVAAASVAGCARPEDMHALKSAAIQQRLMVAALSCNAAASYNDYVKSFQKELQAADQALQTYFRRLAGAATGTTQYHAYKTHLANASSMQSIGNITAYCESTKAMFEASSASAGQGLKTFMAGQDVAVEQEYQPCEVIRTAVADPAAAKAVPVPKMKPKAAATTVARK